MGSSLLPGAGGSWNARPPPPGRGRSRGPPEAAPATRCCGSVGRTCRQSWGLGGHDSYSPERDGVALGGGTTGFLLPALGCRVAYAILPTSASSYFISVVPESEHTAALTSLRRSVTGPASVKWLGLGSNACGLLTTHPRTTGCEQWSTSTFLSPFYLRGN